MKKILLILFLSLSLNAFAQNKERVKALKIAFITEQLQLTETEAQKFWPIYNTFEAENQKLRRETRSKFKGADFESMTDQEAQKHLEEWMATEDKKHELRQQFAKDLLRVLPAKKVIKLKATEDAFNRRMMDQFKKRREGFRKDKP